jgi:hypothetical protein
MVLEDSMKEESQVSIQMMFAFQLANRQLAYHNYSFLGNLPTSSHMSQKVMYWSGFHNSAVNLMSLSLWSLEALVGCQPKMSLVVYQRSIQDSTEIYDPTI